MILQPRGLDYKIMFPGPTGTNAVEAALKLARKVTGREHVLSFTNAFHGMTLGSLAITGNGMKRRGAGIPLSHSTTIPYDDYLDGETPDFLCSTALGDSGSGDKPAAIIVETVQGEGGLAPLAPNGYALACSAPPTACCSLSTTFAGCGRTGTSSRSRRPESFRTSCVSVDLGLRLPALTMFKPELDQWAPGNTTNRGHNLASQREGRDRRVLDHPELQKHVQHIRRSHTNSSKRSRSAPTPPCAGAACSPVCSSPT